MLQYKLFNDNKSKYIGYSKNVKHMGYKKKCSKCNCPLFNYELKCPECGSKKIKKL